MNNFCMNCGGQLKPGMTVCPNCGTPINNVQPTTVYNYSTTQYKNNNTASSVIKGIIFVVLAVMGAWFLLSFLVSFSGPDYSKAKTAKVGESFTCGDFTVTIDKVQFKKKGTRIDSYSVVGDPEWIGVILTVKNNAKYTRTFSSHDLEIINSNGEIITPAVLTYEIWGAEILNSPELISGGSKKGYIQFNNTSADNSNIKIGIDCGVDTYKIDISQK